MFLLNDTVPMNLFVCHKFKRLQLRGLVGLKMFLYFSSTQIYKQSYLKKYLYVIVLQLQDSIKRMYEDMYCLHWHTNSE